ncbi:MAG: hypothetical protein JW760_06115 [Spirochaetales bacterium]|nr:hypothetical protein [Spirochaetales bacterium]
MRSRRYFLLVLLIVLTAAAYGQDQTYTYEFWNRTTQDIFLLASLSEDDSGPIYFHLLLSGERVTFKSPGDSLYYMATNRDYTSYWNHPDESFYRIDHTVMRAKGYPITRDGRTVDESELVRDGHGVQSYCFEKVFVHDIIALLQGEDGHRTETNIAFYEESAVRGRELFESLHYGFISLGDYTNIPWGASMDDIIELENQRAALRLISSREPGPNLRGGHLHYTETYEVEAVRYDQCGYKLYLNNPTDADRTAMRDVWYYFPDGILALVMYFDTYSVQTGNDRERFQRVLEMFPEDIMSGKTETTYQVAYRDGSRHCIWNQLNHSVSILFVHPLYNWTDAFGNFQRDMAQPAGN